MYNMKEIGRVCKLHRMSLGITQREVASELGYSVKLISCFERGLSFNALILLWYISHGVNLLPTLKRCSYGT